MKLAAGTMACLLLACATSAWNTIPSRVHRCRRFRGIRSRNISGVDHLRLQDCLRVFDNTGPDGRKRGYVWHLFETSMASSMSDTAEQDPPLINDDSSQESGETDGLRPYPKVGDIVQYRGKWKEEICFGEIRQLQQVEQTGEWRAYVLGLEDIGQGQYARKKDRKSMAEDAATLRPVRAFYVRSVDGFKVMMNSDTGEPRYISDSYKLDDFELPKKEVDPAKFAVDLATYEQLKTRILLDTVSFGALGSVLAFALFGLDKGLLFAIGAVASTVYVYLLEKSADDVASGNRDTLTKLRGDARFAMPILVVLALAAKHYLSDPQSIQLFSLIPRDDFAAAMIGFVGPSRLPLLYRELRGSLRGEEMLDMVPGSVGQGRQILKRINEADETGKASVPPSGDLAKVIVVSGPRGLGKSTLTQAIKRENNRLASPSWVTTRPKRNSEVDGEDFTFLSQLKFDEIERAGVFLRTYQDEDGESYGLRPEDILAVGTKDKVCIVDADISLVRSLLGVRGIALIGIWVSLDSIAAIEKRARETLVVQGKPEGPELDSDVRARVREAIDGIEFGVTSGVFDFTIINHSVEESLASLREAVAFASA